jgi:hypothetical protein
MPDTISKKFHSKVDQLEKAMINSGKAPAACQWTHIFTPGLYTRQIFMPAGSLITSEIHKTEHPFIVSQGVVSVLMEGEEELKIKAPYIGVTKPGTRRVLFVHEDCIWTTCHPTDKTTVEEVAAEILENYVNPLMKVGEKITYGDGSKFLNGK